MSQVLTGLSGVGKTQLAAAYARAKLWGDWRLVAWVSAGNAGSLLAGLAAVADAAGLSRGRDAAQAGQAVRQLLEADGERCLLVFDDVQDPDLVRPFIPDHGAAQVLMTTMRRPAADLGPNIRVGVFSEKEALAFLDGRTGLGEAGAASLAAELGFLPLALAQAAAVIAGQQLGYASYRKLLNVLPSEDYLAQEQEQPYLSRAAESLVLSLDAARVSDQTGVSSRVMAIMAVLSPAGVRLELLHATGHTGALASDGKRLSEAEVDRSLERLARLSLLDFSLDGRTVIVHHLAAQVVRKALERQGRLTLACRVAAWVLEAHADAPVAGHDHPAPGDLPEQVEALVESAARLFDTAGKDMADALLRLRFLAMSHLAEQGDSAQAVAFGQRLTADLERTLGRDNPGTLRARDCLASAYHAAGRPMVAIPIFELTLGARERVLGPDHPDTVQSREHLAAAYRTTGDVARLIPLAEQILLAQERVLGTDHPRALKARNNLAQAHREAGRAAEAIPLFQQNLTACERLLGPGHPRTISTRNSLALALREAGGTEQGR